MDLCAKKRISSDRRKFITALVIFPETLPSLYYSRITAIPHGSNLALRGLYERKQRFDCENEPVRPADVPADRLLSSFVVHAPSGPEDRRSEGRISGAWC